MIIALMMGRAGSKGLKNKNLMTIRGKKLCEYPLIAAFKSKYVDKIYVSTDCPKIKKISKKYNAQLINRPKNLCTSKALGEKVYEHGYFHIKRDLESQKKNIEMIVLLMANAATINSQLIDKGVKILRQNKNLDSAVTTSIYNMWSPIRARRINKEGTLEPFIPFNKYPKNIKISCDRDSQGDVHFADMSLSIVRPKCLENMKDGLLPQKWMGRKIAPIYSNAGFDLDYKWQVPSLDYWLKKNGKF